MQTPFFQANFGAKIFDVPGGQKLKEGPGSKFCIKNYLPLHSDNPETLYIQRKHALKYGYVKQARYL